MTDQPNLSNDAQAPPEPVPNQNAHDPREKPHTLCLYHQCPEPRRCLTDGCRNPAQS
jgi:hypothetical protein